jgi:hypothetical protein
LGFAALQSFICEQLAGSSGSPRRPLHAVSDVEKRLLLSTVHRPLTQAASSSPKRTPLQSLPSQIRLAPFRAKLLPWGWLLPHRGINQQRPCVGLPKPATFPSSAFRTPSTVCSATSLVGLFRPTATSRVFPSGVFPPAQPRRLISARCPLVVSGDPLPIHRCMSATSRRPALRAFICTGIRCRCASG